jgi:hypothetical protein
MQQHSSKCWHAGTTTVMQPGSSAIIWYNRQYMQQLLLAVLLLGYLACGLSQPVAAAAAAAARSGQQQQQQQQQRGIGSFTTACTADGSLSQQVGAMIASSISRDALLSVTAVRLLGPCGTLGFVTLPVPVKAASLQQQQQQQLVTLVALSSSSELLVRDLQAASVLTQDTSAAAASGSADASSAAAQTSSSSSSSRGESRHLAGVELQIDVTVAADAPFFADLVLWCVTRCPKLLAETAAPELWVEHTGAWAGEQKMNVLWEALKHSNSSSSSDSGGSEPGSSSSSSSDSSRGGRVLPGPVVPGFSKVRLLTLVLLFEAMRRVTSCCLEVLSCCAGMACMVGACSLSATQ